LPTATASEQPDPNLFSPLFVLELFRILVVTNVLAQWDHLTHELEKAHFFLERIANRSRLPQKETGAHLKSTAHPEDPTEVTAGVPVIISNQYSNQLQIHSRMKVTNHCNQIVLDACRTYLLEDNLQAFNCPIKKEQHSWEGIRDSNFKIVTKRADKEDCHCKIPSPSIQRD
jgi:hypothetical protein